MKRKKAADPPAEKKKRRKRGIARMTTAELRQFVDDLVSDRVFTSTMLPKGDAWMLTSCFMPLALGGLRQFTKVELGQIGCIWESMSKRASMAVNGYPTFFSCHIMHRDDWAIVARAARAEAERRKSIELPPERPTKRRRR